MEKGFFRKGIVLGIIVCFVGAGVFPSISGNINNSNAKDKDSTAKITDDTIYNLVGGIRVSCVSRAEGNFKFDWWVAEDRNFTYPVTNGKVKVDCTFLLQTWSDAPFFFLPRVVFVVSTVYDGQKKLGEKLQWDIIILTDVQPKASYLTVETYEIDVPPDGNEFLSVSIAIGFIYPIFFIEGNEKAINFWGYFTR